MYLFSHRFYAVLKIDFYTYASSQLAILRRLNHCTAVMIDSPASEPVDYY